MDTSRLLKKVIPWLKTTTEVKKDLNSPYQLQEQDYSLETFISNIPKFTRDAENQKRHQSTKTDEKQEYCIKTDSDVSTSSGYRSDLPSGMDEMYDMKKMIDLENELRFKREIKEKDEAIIWKAQQKKPKPKAQTAYERDVEILRKRQNKAMEEAQIRELMKLDPIDTQREKAPKDKHDKWHKKSCHLSREERHQKIAIKVTKNPTEEIVKQKHKCNSSSDGTFQESFKKMAYKNKSASVGIQTENIHQKRERRVPKLNTIQDGRNQMAYQNLEKIKKKEIAKEVLEQEKINNEIARRAFLQMLHEKQEREKKIEMQKSLTDAWDSQVEYQRQKKIEMDKAKMQGSRYLIEAERLQQIEETKEQQQLSTQDQTESTSEFAQDEREMRVPEKVQSLEDRQKTVYDNLDNIKKKEAADFVLLEEKRCKERTELQLVKKLREEQERERDANMKKSLADTLNSQIEDKQQKKKEIAEFERQHMAVIMESDRLHQIEEIEIRKQKILKEQIFLRDDESEPNTEDMKKSMDDSLEGILQKEAADDARLQKQLCNSFAKEKGNQILLEIGQQVKTQKKNPLADKLAARYECKQKQKNETDKIERQGVLPGYQAEESRQKKALQQKQKTQDNVSSDQGRADQHESDLDDNISDKDRSRELNKKIVYDQLSVLRKKETNKRAFTEGKLLKEMKHQVAAEQNHQKMEKEKKAAATKSMTDSWDSQIKRKQQEKKELRDLERKEMITLIELERVSGRENKISQLPEQKQPIYYEVWKSPPAEEPGNSNSKSSVGRTVYTADKYDAKSSNISRRLSRQRVSNIMPVRIPSLNAKSVQLSEKCRRETVKLPVIPRPK